MKLVATNPVESVKKSVTLKVIEASDTRLPVMSEADKESYPSPELKNVTKSNGYTVVAVLPEISVDVSGMYDFDVILSDNAPEGAGLLYLANSDKPSSDDEIVEFFDDTGAETSVVPESRNITVSVWLNERVTYSPQIAVKK